MVMVISCLPATAGALYFSLPTLKHTDAAAGAPIPVGLIPITATTDGVIAVVVVFICSLCVSMANWQLSSEGVQSLVLVNLTFASCDKSSLRRPKVPLVLSPCSVSLNVPFNYQITFFTFRIHFLSLHVFFKVTIPPKFFECFLV